ncbi:hypothetical protein COI41_14015 [Bacillus toyonensis]|nr:hypothetical protein CN567_20130 [Bacillus toyonensis]PFX68446.1 hypothetical protein COL37_30710 [Bacillus toyonensis]PFX75594.1 hypothetical protein COL38_29460 [Bacillus toyonensis]PGB05161.1 hypothetical protein COL98_27930 [Bacillus toyonensis]PHF54094.1 hypothetical protein COI41_14015 [Bacillus toyonensis]
MLKIPYEMHYFKQNREKVFNFNDHASLFFMQLHTLHVTQNEIFTISELLNLNFQSLCVISSTKKQKYFL